MEPFDIHQAFTKLFFLCGCAVRPVESWFPDQGFNPPLAVKVRVLRTGLPGTSHILFFFFKPVYLCTFMYIRFLFNLKKCFYLSIYLWLC